MTKTSVPLGEFKKISQTESTRTQQNPEGEKHWG